MIDPLKAVIADGADTALGAGGILFDVAGGVSEAFGPLKAALGVISTVYGNYKVRSRPFAQCTFLTNPPTGHGCRQEKDPRPLFTHRCVGGDFQKTNKRCGGKGAPE